MITIAFLTPNLNFRGSCVALRDYALYNELLLNNRSIIITDHLQQNTSDEIAFNWFVKRFPVFQYDSIHSLDDILLDEDVDILYIIKYGNNDGVGDHNVLKVKTVIHCVFDMTQPHGDVYAGVSKSLANKFGSNLYVPHMISMTPTKGNNMRNELGIPEDAIVFGRHGGKDTFNLEWAKNIFSQIVRERKDIYFVFLNANVFDNHPQIIVLDATTDTNRKKQFIRTCDAMVVPETMGHTSGIAIMEMSIYNKPIICYNGQVWNTAHIDVLGDKGVYFDNPDRLYEIITTFKKSDYEDKDWNAYRSYNPLDVMTQFRKVFIDS
jgi:hypothetical protein